MKPFPSNELVAQHTLRMSRRESLAALGAVAISLGASSVPVLAAAGKASAPDWERISKEFLLDKSLTYLNTGSLGAIPKPVLAKRRTIEEKLESNPVGEGFGSVLRDAEAAFLAFARVRAERAPQR